MLKRAELPLLKIGKFLLFCFLVNIGCLNKHGTQVTANNPTNSNVFFFCFRFENSIL